MTYEELRQMNEKQDVSNNLYHQAKKETVDDRAQNYIKEEFYYPERDKSGNANCIIRFIPGSAKENFIPYVDRRNHSIQCNGGAWYIENCPRTLDSEAQCPACEYHTQLKGNRNWNTMDKTEKDELRTFAQKKNYFCNVLVVKDPATPENEGKVFPFKFGPAILNKISEMYEPENDGLEDPKDPVDVFNLVHGANFIFKIRIKSGRTNYDTSKFDVISECKPYNISEVTELNKYRSDENFKDYETLSGRFNSVMNIDENVTKTANDAVNETKNHVMDDDDVPDFDAPNIADDADFDEDELFKEYAE